MQRHSPATIFLADNYQADQTEERRSINVLGTRQVQEPLTAFSDESLAAGAAAEYLPVNNTMLLPIVGNIIVITDQGEQELACGELLVVEAGTSLKIGNPYKEHLVNFLLVQFRSGTCERPKASTCHFDLDKHKNQITELLNNKDLKLSLGKFEMRRETVYSLSRPQKPIFCFVIQGSFEIEGRLLHERD